MSFIPYPISLAWGIAYVAPYSMREMMQKYRFGNMLAYVDNYSFTHNYRFSTAVPLRLRQSTY